MAEESRLTCRIQSMGRTESLVHTANMGSRVAPCPEVVLVLGWMSPSPGLQSLQGPPACSLELFPFLHPASSQSTRPAYIEEDDMSMVPLKRGVDSGIGVIAGTF